MARLPEVTDLGRRRPQAGRPIASVGNAGAVGDAAARFGSTVAQVGERIAEREADFELATAKSRWLRESLELEQSIKDEKPFQEWGDAYGSTLSERQAKIAEGLRDNRARQAFTLYAETATARAQARLREDARERLGSERRAVLSNNVTANVDAAVATPDRATRTALLEATQDMIDGLVEESDLSPERAAELKRSVVREFSRRSLTVMDPEARLSELNDPDGVARFLPADEIAALRRQAQDDVRTTRREEAIRAGRQAGADAAAALQTGRVGGSRSWRNNNPGNIEYGDFAKSYGAIASDGRFAVFPDEATGRAAMEALLTGPTYSGLNVRQAIARYAPASENNVDAYVAAVRGAGVPDDVPIGEMDDDTRANLLEAMIQHEGWTPGDEASSPEAWLMQIEDDDARIAASAEYNRQLALMENARKRRMAEIEQAAFALVNEGGSVLDLAPEDKNMIGRAAMQSLISYERAVQAGEAVVTDPAFYTELMELYAIDPAAFKAANPLEWRGRLDDADYKSMVEKRAALLGEAPAGERIGTRTASALLTAARGRLEAAGIGTTASASDADRARAAEFQSSLLREADAFVRREGRRMTDLELDDTIRWLLTEVVVNPTGVWNEATVPLFEVGGLDVTPEDVAGGSLSIGGKEIPQTTVQRAAAQFQEQTGRAPSAAELIELLVMAGAHR